MTVHTLLVYSMTVQLVPAQQVSACKSSLQGPSCKNGWDSELICMIWCTADRQPLWAAHPPKGTSAPGVTAALPGTKACDCATATTFCVLVG
jgi:hypothetical protein